MVVGEARKPLDPVLVAEGTTVKLTVRAEPAFVPSDPAVVLRFVEEIAALPPEGEPDEGFSGADHDKVLYGGTDAR